jgi:probable O-glycosylation ligase (exosortase A-associated)
METIETYQREDSAASRMETWKIGLDYAISHPVTGAGFEGWRYVTYDQTGIDWHSAYIEILAEHGFVALSLWIALLFGSILGLIRFTSQCKHLPQLKWAKSYSHMLQTSLIAYAVGALFIGIGYWDIFYHLLIISVILKNLTRHDLEITNK